MTTLLLMVIFPASGVSRSQKTEKPIVRDNYLYYFDDSSFITVADRILPNVRSRLGALIGDTLPYKPAIYIVDDLNYFNKLIGGKFPDWGAAAAFPERKLIAIKSPTRFNINRSLEELLAHEYAHLVTSHTSGFHSPPRWLDEGLSMFVSMEWSWSDNLAMSKAAVFGQYVSFEEIERVNRFSEGKAHVAYAQSYLAVTFLIDNYTKNAVRVFLNEVALGKSPEIALYVATGSTPEEFEGDFRAHLNGRFNVLSLFMDTIFFWLGLAIIAIVGALLKFRKRRQYYRKWEQEERIHSTDFDYGDVENPEQLDDDDEP